MLDMDLQPQMKVVQIAGSKKSCSPPASGWCRSLHPSRPNPGSMAGPEPAGFIF